MPCGAADHLTDVIKELNVPCGVAVEPPAAEPSAAERYADAAALLRVLLNELESHDANARAAEHSAAASAKPPKKTSECEPPLVCAPAPKKAKPKHDHWWLVDEEE